MSNEIQLCVRGWLGSEPILHVGPSGGRLVRFRLGVTPRVRDRGTGEFRDGVTQWFTVKAWRDLGDNVCDSLTKGDPVLVRGVLSTDTWQSDGQERSDHVIMADAIGVELGTGIARFTRTVRRSPQVEDAAPDAGPGSGSGSATVSTEGGRWDVEAELDDDAEQDAADTMVAAGAPGEEDAIPSGQVESLAGATD